MGARAQLKDSSAQAYNPKPSKDIIENVNEMRRCAELYTRRALAPVPLEVETVAALTLSLEVGRR